MVIIPRRYGGGGGGGGGGRERERRRRRERGEEREEKKKKKVIWCFTPSQPLRLYQGEEEGVFKRAATASQNGLSPVEKLS